MSETVVTTEAMRAAIAAGQEPRRDYDALRDVLDADVLHPDDVRATRIGALLARRLGLPPLRRRAAWPATPRGHSTARSGLFCLGANAWIILNHLSLDTCAMLVTAW